MARFLSSCVRGTPMRSFYEASPVQLGRAHGKKHSRSGQSKAKCAIGSKARWRCLSPLLQPLGMVAVQVRMLSQAGVKEVTLLGQNVNSYADWSEAEGGGPPRSPPGAAAQDAAAVYAQVTATPAPSAIVTCSCSTVDAARAAQTSLQRSNSLHICMARRGLGSAGTSVLQAATCASAISFDHVAWKQTD